MNTDSRQLSFSRMLMLMNSTQRKLQTQESIYDSDSPLKAIQLLKIAQRLNDELNYVETSQVRTPLREYQSPSFVVSQRSIDDEDEDLEDEEDPFLVEMQSAIEVRHVDNNEPEAAPVQIVESEIPEPEGMDIPIGHQANNESATTATTTTTSVEEVFDGEDIADRDVAEIDMTLLDDTDMPMLSRQVSYGSIPSLYHSDHSEDEDEYDEEESPSDSYHREHVLPRYHHHLVSHPALSLLTKEPLTHNHDHIPLHAQASIA